MKQCHNCSSFIPKDCCPLCGKVAPSQEDHFITNKNLRSSLFMKACGLGAVGITLMACYGAPPEHNFDDWLTACEKDDGCQSGEQCIDTICVPTHSDDKN